MCHPQSRALSWAAHGAAYAAAYALLAPPGTPPLAALALAGPLVWASAADFERREIPDAAAALLLAGGLAAAWAAAPALALAHLAAAAAWAAAFLALAALYRRLRGFDGLGQGDATLIAGIAAWIGFEGTVAAVLAGALSGIALILALRLTSRGEAALLTSSVAFGPFLCLPAWAIWLAGGTP